MIHKIKTVTWEVRSHNQTTRLTDKGVMIEFNWEDYYKVGERDKSIVKRLIWHLQDVLKCMRQIEKEKAPRGSIDNPCATVDEAMGLVSPHYKQTLFVRGKRGKVVEYEQKSKKEKQANKEKA